MERLTLVSLLDVIGELFSDEISIAVSNTSEYIYYRSSKRVDLKIRQGDAVKKGTIAHKALLSKQKVSEFINRDIFLGFHIMGWLSRSNRMENWKGVSWQFIQP